MWDPNGYAGWLMIFMTVCFFKLVSEIFARVIEIPAGVYRGYEDEYRIFRWRNLVISFIHAAITGCCSLTCVILYGKYMLADMVLYVNWPIYALCSFATGYFIYDTLDIVTVGWSIPKWEVLLHHAAVLIISTYVITFTHCVGYQTMGMLIEVNTVFLHRRQLFQLADKSSHSDRLVRANMYANLFTFVAFRIFPLAYLTYGLFYDGHRVPVWFIRFYSTCILLINIINAVLLYRLLRADVWSVDQRREHGKGGKTRKDEREIADAFRDRIDVGGSLHLNGIRLRQNVDHIMKHVVQTNVHS